MAEQVFRPATGLISGRVTPAVFPFFTSGEDNLRLVSFNSVTGVKLRLTVRTLGDNGRPIPGGVDQIPATDRSSTSTDCPLSGTTILNVDVHATAGVPKVGQTFVIVQLIRGLGTAAIVLGTILQGYVTTTQGLGWPGSAIVSSTDGEPALRTLTGTTPAAGAEALETVPTGARWELLAVLCVLTTNAVAGARTPNVQIADAAGRLSQTVNASALNNLQTGTFYLAQNLAYGSIPASLIFNWPIPQGLRLLAGQTFGTTTAGLQAGDQWSAPIYSVRDWLDV